MSDRDPIERLSAMDPLPEGVSRTSEHTEARRAMFEEITQMPTATESTPTDPSKRRQDEAGSVPYLVAADEKPSRPWIGLAAVAALVAVIAGTLVVNRSDEERSVYLEMSEAVVDIEAADSGVVGFMLRADTGGRELDETSSLFLPDGAFDAEISFDPSGAALADVEFLTFGPMSARRGTEIMRIGTDIYTRRDGEAKWVLDREAAVGEDADVLVPPADPVNLSGLVGLLDPELVVVSDVGDLRRFVAPLDIMRVIEADPDTLPFLFVDVFDSDAAEWADQAEAEITIDARDDRLVEVVVDVVGLGADYAGMSYTAELDYSRVGDDIVIEAPPESEVETRRDVDARNLADSERELLSEPLLEAAYPDFYQELREGGAVSGCVPPSETSIVLLIESGAADSLRSCLSDLGRPDLADTVSGMEQTLADAPLDVLEADAIAVKEELLADPLARLEAVAGDVPLDTCLDLESRDLEFFVLFEAAWLAEEVSTCLDGLGSDEAVAAFAEGVALVGGSIEGTPAVSAPSEEG